MERSFDTLLVSSADEGAIVTVTLNRPHKLNAMTTELMNELYEALDTLEFDDTCRVVILTGSGRGFCAGADLLANALGVGGTKWDSTRISNQERFSRVSTKIARLPQTVIAAVHGPVAGGGFALALAADMRIAGESAKMNAAFVKIGLSGCEMGVSYFLPKVSCWIRLPEWTLDSAQCAVRKWGTVGRHSQRTYFTDSLTPSSPESHRTACGLFKRSRDPHDGRRR